MSKKIRPKRARISSVPRSIFTPGWKVLIFISIMLSLTGFWINYSQIAYLTDVLEHTLPISIPETEHQTAVVVPPTGSFIFVDSMTLFGFAISLTFLSILYVVLEGQ